jgi:phosphate transport system substrate-binding protein
MYPRMVVPALALVLTASAAAEGPAGVDPALPAYEAAPGISGKLSSIGSDTLKNLMLHWAEDFAKRHPGVEIEVEGKGSSTAPPALLEGKAQLGPMSRPMKASESVLLEQRFGCKPLRVEIGIDCLAIYVHRDNPLESLSLPEVDAVFSSTRHRAHAAADTWGDLGLTGEWASRSVSVYGRNSISGTHAFFAAEALLKGRFKEAVREQPGSAAVVERVASDRFAIGYSGIGYRTPGVRALPLAARPGAPAHAPDYENALAKKYPLARKLYIYVIRQPGKPLDLLQLEFLKYALSKQGQEQVVRDGYLPLPASAAKEMLELVEGRNDS